MTVPPENSARPVLDNPRGAARTSDLPVRAASAMIMAPAALALTLIGGLPFVLLWCAAAMVIFWEWSGLVAPGLWRVLAAGLVGLAATGVLVMLGAFGIALIACGVGAVIVALCAPTDRRLWAAAGVPYAGIAIMAPSVLRADPDFGLAAIVLLFALVWVTDILGYFVGRWVGGPKLWRPVSPAKTWSGAIGGLVGAMLVGLAAGWLARLPYLVTVCIGLLLSIAAQIGDLTNPPSNAGLASRTPAISFPAMAA